MKIYKSINSNLYKMIILFTLYSFLGWTCEVLYAYSIHHHFVNRGFLTGPFCTIYGFGFLIIYLLLHKFKSNICSLFIFSILLTSALELITGWALDTFFHTQYWNYTSYPLNIKGYICFYFSLIWGIGSIIVIKILNPVISFLISLCPFVLPNKTPSGTIDAHLPPFLSILRNNAKNNNSVFLVLVTFNKSALTAS